MHKITSQYSDKVNIILLVCLHEILSTKLGKIAPPTSQEIQVTVIKEVKETDLTEKNKTELWRYKPHPGKQLAVYLKI